jgi:hypothetical protein
MSKIKQIMDAFNEFHLIGLVLIALIFCFGCAQYSDIEKEKYKYKIEQTKLQQIEALKKVENKEEISINVQEKNIESNNTK